MMNFFSRIGQSLLVGLFAFCFAGLVLAQNSAHPVQLNPARKTEVSHLRPIKCAACAGLTNHFNDALGDLFNIEDELEAWGRTIHQNEVTLKTTEAELASLQIQFIRKPTANLKGRVDQAANQQLALTQRLARQNAQLFRTAREYNTFGENVDQAYLSLNDCEARFCALH